MELRPTVLRLAIVAPGAVIALMLFVAPAHAGGGDYRFDGGTPAARAQVRAALEASSFDWDVVPVGVTIHIRRGVSPHARPGDIWLDGRLLAAGRFAWGIVQHEYAHQVAFFAVEPPMRRRLTRVFGARAWCHESGSHAHHANACERFADLLTWSHWRSPHNVVSPPHRSGARSARRLVASALRTVP